MNYKIIFAFVLTIGVITSIKSQRFMSVGNEICCETLDKVGRLSRSWISENDCMNLNGIDLNFNNELECLRDNINLVKRSGFKILDVCCKLVNNNKTEFSWTTNQSCKANGGNESTIKDMYSCLRAQRIPDEPIRTDICCTKISNDGKLSYNWMNKNKCYEENGSESYPTEKEECEIWDPKNDSKREEYFKQTCCKIWRVDGKSSFKWISRNLCESANGEEFISFDNKEKCLTNNLKQ